MTKRCRWCGGHGIGRVPKQLDKCRARLLYGPCEEWKDGMPRWPQFVFLDEYVDANDFTIKPRLKNRFYVINSDEAIKQGLIDSAYDFYYLLIDRKTGEVIGDDHMEPEDAIFPRDLSWVVDLLNELSK